jgi:hypothetical protein
MQIHINQGFLRRRLRLSIVFLFSSMVFLIGGFIVSITQQDLALQYAVTTPALLIGLVLWALNQRYLARWGPRMRQDAVLVRGLRGLDDRYSFFAFPGQGLPDYLVVGPMGVVVLVPRAVTGTVTCYEGRWHHDTGRSTLFRTLTWFVHRPSLGNPGREAQRGIETVYRFLSGKLPPELRERVRVDGAVVLTHPNIELSQRGSPVQAILLKSLRGHLRRMPRGLSPREGSAVAAALGAD